LPAGIVDQKIQPSEVAERRCDDRLHALLLADVAGVAARLAAGIRDLARDGLELVLLAADQRHFRAERGELMRRAAANAAAGPGHDAGLTCEQVGTEDRIERRPHNCGFAIHQANAW
jgi:hypothetical protein